MSVGSFLPGRAIGLIRIPGSKSLTIRALVAAAMAPGRSHLYGALTSEDTTAALGVLDGFGITVDISDDPWVVDGGRFAEPSTVLDARDSGLTARLALGMSAQLHTEVSVDGTPRLRERPMEPLITALRSQGVRVDGDRLPVTIEGQGGMWGGDIEIDSTLSSQFVTALLLVSPLNRNPTTIRLVGERVSEGYLDLTIGVMREFGAEVAMTVTGYEVANTGYRPADVEIEPDVSAAVYPMVAAAITGGRVEIAGVRLDSQQPDIVVARYLASMGCRIAEGSAGLVVEGSETLQPIDVNMRAAPDGAMALAVACLFANGPSRIDGLETFRHKESDRFEALRDGMGRLGASVDVDGDALVITPGVMRSATIASYRDHRVAMALALVGLRVEGVDVEDPGVVAKTWPNYWDAMAALIT